MSAFLVSKETMHRVVTALMPEDQGSAWGDLMGLRLFAMNVAALKACYGGDEPALEYRYLWREGSKIELLKACKCLRYQCSEGKVPETWPEYAQLEECINRLMSEIIYGLPEYDAAPWNYPD